MARLLIISSTICYMWLAVCLGAASGIENTHVKGTHIYPEPLDKGGRTRRDVMAEQVEASPSISMSPNGIVGGGERPEDGGRSSSSDGNLGTPLNYGPIKQLVKRAPSGFTGMRGKKEFADATRNKLNMWNLLPTETGYELDDFSDPNAERYKKAPNAFYGVRGKKYSTDLLRLNEILGRLEEEQMRESWLQQFLDRLAATTAVQNEIAKRAPTGFTGMRGKRPAPATSYFEVKEQDLDKRGPVNGFVGVRGKKAVDHQNVKRSPAMSRSGKYPYFDDFRNKFVAVRGKKSTNGAPDEDFKVENTDRETPIDVDVEVEDDDEVWRMLDGEDNGGDRVDESGDVTALRPPGGGMLLHPRQRYFGNMLPSVVFSSGHGSGKRVTGDFTGKRVKRAAAAPLQEAVSETHRVTSTAQ